MLKLGEAKDKVEIMTTVGGQYENLEYEVHDIDDEMVVAKRIPSKESAIGIVNDARKEIKRLIHQFVYRLASSSKESSYYCEILSKDDRFMEVLEEIYANIHKGFETGYNKIKNRN